MNTRKNIKKVSKEKATPKNIALNFFRLVKYISMALVVAIPLGTIAYYGTHVVSDFVSKPIASVLVKADLQYLEQDVVIELLSQNINKSFLRENLESMRKNLEQNPWIDTVILKREWPDKLQVIIEEQRPIAKWDGEGFVNHRGELVLTDVRQSLDMLPVLKGNPDDALEIMRQYQHLSELFSDNALKIQTLEKKEIGIWLLSLNNGWQLVAGRDGVANKIHQLLVMIERNMIANPEHIQQVDMRYQGGLAVKLRPTSSFDQSVAIVEDAKENTSSARYIQEKEG